MIVNKKRLTYICIGATINMNLKREEWKNEEFKFEK